MKEMTQSEPIARQDNIVDELDGPPRAYFEIPLDTGIARQVIRVHYFTIIWPITQEHVEDNLQMKVAGELVEAVKDELFKIGGGIIWWRTRPALAAYNGPFGQIFKVRCRVATTPELSQEAQNRLYRHAEGQRIT